MTDPAVAFVGLHHVRLPVSDVIRSRDWYIEVLGFDPCLSVEDEDHVIGIVIDHPSGLVVGLHYAPALARALRGFCSIALSVGELEDLNRCCERLDLLGISHSQPAQGHLGWFVDVPDPDGLVIELHTTGQPSSDEA